MKRTSTTLFLATVGTCLKLSALVSSAQIADITVNNGYGTYSQVYGTSVTNPDPRPGVDALSYVDNGNSAEKRWDLEAFGYDSTATTLTYVGGFNPIGEVDPATNITYGFGDLFFSTTSIKDGAGEPNIPQSAVYNIPVTALDYSNPGFSYAIHWTSITNTTLSYNIYALSNQAQLLTPNFQENQNAGPFQLDVANSPAGSLTLIGSGSTAITTETNAQVDALLNEQLFYGTTKDDPAADNFVASFDLSQLDLSQFNVQLTEACGNDLLAGSNFSATPEPRSFALGLMAWLVFMGVIARHRSRNP